MKFLVETETSSYILDEETYTLECFAGAEAEGEPLRLVQMLQLVVGESMVATVDLRGDGGHTRQASTPVQRIINIDELWANS